MHIYEAGQVALSGLTAKFSFFLPNTAVMQVVSSFRPRPSNFFTSRHKLSTPTLSSGRRQCALPAHLSAPPIFSVSCDCCFVQQVHKAHWVIGTKGKAVQGKMPRHFPLFDYFPYSSLSLATPLHSQRLCSQRRQQVCLFLLAQKLQKAMIACQRGSREHQQQQRRHTLTTGGFSHFRLTFSKSYSM